MTAAPKSSASAVAPSRESSASDALFGVGEQLDLFGGPGRSQIQGDNAKRYKIETFAPADAWGQFEADTNTIYLHEALSRREALIVLFHEAAHALWEMEKLGKKEGEEMVCGVIAEGLAQMILGNELEPLIKAAKAESSEVPPRRRFATPEMVLALDCEGIEAAVAANRSVRNAPMDYRPFDMFSHAAVSTHNPDGTRRNLDWIPRNRYLVRQGVKAVRRARARVRESMESEPPRAWALHFELLELAERSLRVRYYWRNGDRVDFIPPNTTAHAPENNQ
ncbi:MAG: hypothetical protein QM680_13975 [Luteolibacter sp.]